MNNKTPEELEARIAQLEQSLDFQRGNSSAWMRQAEAYDADRRNLEAEVRRLQGLLSGKPADQAKTMIAPELPADTLTTALWPRAGMTPEQFAGWGAVASPSDLKKEAARACNELDRKACAHEVEEKSLATYWQEKYHELKRLKAMEDKVAADHVASLQTKLGKSMDKTISLEAKLKAIDAACHTGNTELNMNWQLKVMVEELKAENAELKAQLEGARARAAQESEEFSCVKGKIDDIRQVLGRTL